MSDELPLFFDCNGDRLLGILHQPDTPAVEVGMVLVVGGPQYRVGSHRQFVLLARDLAAAGIPVLRFDYRGMGDSCGVFRDFERVGDDIRAAVDTLMANSPAVRKVVLWGLCDAASANAFYALSDDRIVGQIGANPWARTAEGEAQAFIRHYYLKRFTSRAFWRKVLRLEFDLLGATRDFLHKLGQSRGQGGDTQIQPDTRPLPARLRDAQMSFGGATMLVLSGQDLTAGEYLDRVGESPEWIRWLESGEVEVHRFEAADHTFSCEAWRNQVSLWTRDWIIGLGQRS